MKLNLVYGSWTSVPDDYTGNGEFPYDVLPKLRNQDVLYCRWGWSAMFEANTKVILYIEFCEFQFVRPRDRKNQ